MSLRQRSVTEPGRGAGNAPGNGAAQSRTSASQVSTQADGQVGPGERFARALAARDGAAMRGLLTDPVDFSALTPGRHWQAHAPRHVVDEIILGRWFGSGAQSLDLQSVASGQVAECQHVAYRLLVRSTGGAYLVEQQAYFRTSGEQISWMRVLCSGYQPVADGRWPRRLAEVAGGCRHHPAEPAGSPIRALFAAYRLANARLVVPVLA